MTPATATSPARPARLARCCQAAMGQLSDRVHAAGDARAQAMGWTITRTPGLLGLAGRTYRDPRFDAQRRPAGAARNPGRVTGRPS